MHAFPRPSLLCPAVTHREANKNRKPGAPERGVVKSMLQSKLSNRRREAAFGGESHLSYFIDFTWALNPCLPWHRRKATNI